MLSRLPWTPAPEKPKPKVRRFNRDRRRHLVERVAKIMREARDTGEAATLMSLEAPIRHGLRSKLCLAGWGWQEADDIARDIVDGALRHVGARRPTWAEGQPEWGQQGAGALIERTRCVRCHVRLPEGHTKFCSDLCASAHHMRIARRQQATEARAYDFAARA